MTVARPLEAALSDSPKPAAWQPVLRRAGAFLLVLLTLSALREGYKAHGATTNSRLTVQVTEGGNEPAPTLAGGWAASLPPLSP